MSLIFNKSYVLNRENDHDFLMLNLLLREPSTSHFLMSQIIDWWLYLVLLLMQISSAGSEVPYVLLVYQAEEFCELVSKEKLIDHVHRVQSLYPSFTICYLTNKLMSYINKWWVPFSSLAYNFNILWLFWQPWYFKTFSKDLATRNFASSTTFLHHNCYFAVSCIHTANIYIDGYLFNLTIDVMY